MAFSFRPFQKIIFFVYTIHVYWAHAFMRSNLMKWILLE